jgi:hypothetical protein
MKNKEFYSEVGKLLYAMAYIDGVISPEEKKEMQNHLRKDLIPVENNQDEFGTNVANYTEFEFDILEEEIADAETSLQSFIDFMEEHSTAIDEKKKNQCLYLADRIANAYRGTNKSEKKLIKRLKEMLIEI